MHEISQFLFQVILWKHSNKIAHYWNKNEHVEPWNKGLKYRPVHLNQLIFDRDEKTALEKRQHHLQMTLRKWDAHM